MNDILPLNSLLAKIKETPPYGIVIPLTVTLHRLERDYQDLSKPRIFVREYDEFGFTIAFQTNTMYQNTLGAKVKDVIDGLSQHGGERIVESVSWLKDRAACTLIQTMALFDYAEGEIYQIMKRILSQEQVDQLPPIIARRYGPRGIPKAYALNTRVVTVVKSKGELVMNIGGLPITDEEARTADIEGLLQMLANPQK